MRLPAALVINQRDSGKGSPAYRWRRLLWPWLLVGTAWAVALLAVFTRHTEWGDHHYLLQTSGLPFVSALGFFLASWQVMILAMMVPSMTPLLRLMTSAARTSASPPGSLAMFLAGYDLVWTAFGCAAFLGDALVHRLVASWSWLGIHNAIIATGLLAVAGAYQFTPRKTRFVMACQGEPGGFSQSHRTDMTRLDTACRAGVHNGFSHLGSCWALMLAMFGVGMGSLVWMAALTGVMVAEQLRGPRASALRWSVGAIFCALAVLTLALPATPPGRFGLAGPLFFW
jgi:predicted metal-binding membrane protein